MSALSTVIARGALGSRPAAGNTGRLYFATDNPTALYRDNGSSWDTMEGNGGAKVGAHAYHSTTQTLTSGVGAMANLDSEVFDPDGFHSTSSGTSKMTVPTGFGGSYLVAGKASFAGAAGGSTRAASIYKNAALVNGGGAQDGPSGSNFMAIPTPVVLVVMSATDYAEINLYQDSGGNLNSGFATGSASNALWIHLLGT